MERKNLAGNIVIRPEAIKTPSTVDEVVEIIQTAERQNKKVRAIGSGWSYSAVAHTDDILVETSKLNRLIGYSIGRTNSGDIVNGEPHLSAVLMNSLTDRVADNNKRRFVHAEAGIRLRELFQRLDNRRVHAPWDPNAFDAYRSRWALYTQGGAGGQTLAGAISTGTHGTTLLPPISDWVRAIRLIGPGGVQHWIERPGLGSITDPDRLLNAIPQLQKDNLHYDQEWFNAVLVSMGCMGIIVEYVVEVREQYGISQRLKSTTWNDVKPMLTAPFTTGLLTSDFDQIIRHTDSLKGVRFDPTNAGVEVLLNPYRLSDNYQGDPAPNRRCVIVSRAIPQPGTTVEGFFEDPPLQITGSDAILSPLAYFFSTQLHQMIDIMKAEAGGPGTVANVINGLIDSLRKEDGRYFASHLVLDTYDYNSALPPILSFEAAIPTFENRHLQFVDRLLEDFDSFIRRGGGRKFAGAFSLRFTQPSVGFLAMQNARLSRNMPVCHVEALILMELNAVDHRDESGNMEGLSDEFAESFENAVYEAGGRLHWGQLHRLDRNRTESGYTTTLPEWRKVRTEVAEPGRAHTFSNWFSQRCGLEPYSEVVSASSGTHKLYSYSEAGHLLQMDTRSDARWKNVGNRFPDKQRPLGPLCVCVDGRDSRRDDLFAIGRDDALLHSWAAPGSPRDWSSLGNGFESDEKFVGPLAGVLIDRPSLSLPSSPEASIAMLSVYGLGVSGDLLRVRFEVYAPGPHIRGTRDTSGLSSPFLDVPDDHSADDLSTFDEDDRALLDGVRQANDGRMKWDWHGELTWESLGNGFVSGNGFAGSISAISSDGGTVFGIGRNGNVLIMVDNYGNRQWIDLGNGFADGRRFSGPITAVVTKSLHRIDIFGTAIDGHVLRLWTDGLLLTDGWHWDDLGNGFPNVLARRYGPPNSFSEVTGAPYQVLEKHNVRDRFVGPLTAIGDAYRLCVYGIGESGRLLQLERSQGGWTWSANDHVYRTKMNELKPGEALRTGEALMSMNGTYALEILDQGNLVVYRTDDQVRLWTSNTPHSAAESLILTEAGELVLVATVPAPLISLSVMWKAPVTKAGSRLVLGEDGVVTLYQADGVAIWSSLVLPRFITLPVIKPVNPDTDP